MFGNHSNTRTLPLPTKKSSGQNSPMTERAVDDRLSSFDQSTSSTVTLTDHTVNKAVSPVVPPEHTSTPINAGSTDVADYGKSSKSKGHRRTRSLERGFNTSVKLYDNSGLPIPKRM